MACKAVEKDVAKSFLKQLRCNVIITKHSKTYTDTAIDFVVNLKTSPKTINILEFITVWKFSSPHCTVQHVDPYMLDPINWPVHITFFEIWILSL